MPVLRASAFPAASAAVRRLALPSAALALLAFLHTPVAGQESPPPTPPPAEASEQAEGGVFFPETFTLDNGMQVVVVTNKRVPVVSHMVWYKVGAADEAPGQSGIAHFLEHLMFKATDELAPGEFSRVVARHGGRDNAFTSWDYTGYFQNVAKDRLELVMKMEADRMVDLQLTDEVVLPEREVILEERRQRTENEPGARLAEQVNAALFVHHPYGTPIIGWAHEIRELDRADAVEFYRTWYAPNNAVLVVAGDITADELRPLAEKYYGAIPSRPLPPRIRVQEPLLEAERRVILRDPEVRQPSLRKLFKAPSYNRDATQHVYPLQVLSEILGGGSTSRLYRSLVVDQGLAVGIGTGYSPTAYDLAVFGVYASPTPGTDLEALEAGIDAEIDRLLKDGVEAAEVQDAKKRLQRGAIFARDSLQGPAHTFGAALATGGTVEDVEQWPARIAAVTPEQVEEAARYVLTRKDFVVGLLLPTEARPAEGDAAAAPEGPAGSVSVSPQQEISQ